ncbi:MAG: hypothetical protein JSR66_07175 [Proteobacteria bacterium]|nr:hypothetical protein [Pseudomonadota bacterium]
MIHLKAASRRGRKHTGRARQGGQAIVLFMAMVVACCCILALVYNVGQVTNRKEETINAADAAALSGALVEARMLNFQAYLNRAQVANEVTIAQLVSLESFVNYNQTLFQNIATYTAIIPYLDEVTQAASDGATAIQEVTEPIIAATIPAVEAVNAELNAVQLAAYFGAAEAAREVSQKVAQANQTTFDGRDDEQPKLTAGTVAFAINQASWLQFTDAADSSVTKNMVLVSRDPFSTHRDNGFLLDSLNYAFEVLGGFISYTVLDKTSGDTVLDGNDHWIAQDSLDLASGGVQTTLGIPTGYGTEVDPFSPPLGYGRSEAGSGKKHNLCTETGLFGAPTVNCQLAEDNAVSHSYNGLPELRDLATDLSKNDPCSTNNGSDSPSLPYVMAVQRSGNSTKTTQRLGMDNVALPDPGDATGSPQLTDNLQNGDSVTSIAEACVFFYRPDFNTADHTEGGLPRPDGIHEFASLFNPYWQARLTTADAKWSALLYATIHQAGVDVALNAASRL